MNDAFSKQLLQFVRGFENVENLPFLILSSAKEGVFTITIVGQIIKILHLPKLQCKLFQPMSLQ